MPAGSRPRVAALLLLASAVASSLTGCATEVAPGATQPTAIPASLGPGRTVTPTVGETRGELARVLGERNLVLSDTQRPFRPAESPTLTSAPRAVYQVILPADPDGGFIVVYELPDAAAAAAAGTEQAAYLASGPGKVQSPLGTIHVIRQVGSTLVLYSWLPEAAQDEQAPDVQAALDTLGIGIPVPA